jgi:hypothetical protein
MTTWPLRQTTSAVLRNGERIMNAETIKDFLVSLGFDIDEAGASKFDSVLAGTTANAIKMGLAVEGAALTVVAFTAKIASGWIISTGRHSAPARRFRGFSLLAMRFRRWAAAWTRRAPLWKASPGLFVTIPARKAS